jgi:hypothetical protein
MASVKDDAFPPPSLRPQPRERQGRRLGPRAAVTVVAVALTLVAAGCGGSSGAKVAQVGTSSGANGSGSSSGSGSRDPQAFSACMRAHGVANFPDPGADGTIQIPSTIDDRLPTVRAAYRACRSLAPSSLTGQGDVMHQDQLLAFATCMRSHGVPSFPDPQVANGHINMSATAQHFDPNSPIATAAMAACRSKLGKSPGRGAEKLVQGAALGTGGKGK